MALVILPRSLAALFPGIDRRTVIDAATVDEAISALDARWPGVRDRLCDAGPTIREHVNVFVDGEPANLHTPLRADATVHVIPAITGG